MRSIKNHNITQYVALYNKGIGVVVRTFDSLTKKDKKKMVNYLDWPKIKCKKMQRIARFFACFY